MAYSSRDKLNAIFAAGTIAVAAVMGAIAGSWVLFLLIAGGLFGVCFGTGLIRLDDVPRRKRRR